MGVPTEDRIVATVGREMKARIEEAAKRQNCSTSAVVSAALMSYFGSVDRPAPGMQPSLSGDGDVQAFLAELRPLIPLLSSTANGFRDLQEQVDDLVIGLYTILKGPG
jgi:hypothetical protein